MDTTHNIVRVVAWLATATMVATAASFLAVGVVSAEPALTEALPADGQLLDEPPDTLHLCFSEPVKIEDPADFQFVVKAPDNRQPGTRTVFQPDGLCVDIFPGSLENTPAGIWTFEWMVRSQADGSEGAGTIRLQVGGDFGLTPVPITDSTSGTGGDGGASPWLFVAIALGAVAGTGIAAAVIALRRRSKAA